MPRTKKRRQALATIDREAMGREVWRVAHDADRAFASAVLIAKALTAQNADDDFEIARCVQSELADELNRIVKRLARLSRRLGTRAFVRQRPHASATLERSGAATAHK